MRTNLTLKEKIAIKEFLSSGIKRKAIKKGYNIGKYGGKPEGINNVLDVMASRVFKRPLVKLMIEKIDREVSDQLKLSSLESVKQLNYLMNYAKDDYVRFKAAQDILDRAGV